MIIYKMPPKKVKSTDSLINELENLRMNSEKRGSMSSYPSVSSMSSNISSLNSSRRSTPANELLNSIIDDDMSEVSNKAVVAPKRIKPKKSQRISAKLKKPNKTRRGGRTPKEVYYKYSPNTGKRIRMTTKKKN
tara:strand:- start:8035 stop:8436 length:402 start_codon:yes stop_codon:yes gene_type:complete